MNEKKRINVRANVNRLVIIAAILLLLKLFAYAVEEFLPVFASVVGQLISAFLPFIFALVLAFLMEPLVSRLMKYLKMKRVYASLLVLVFFILLILALLVLMGSRLYRELAELATSFPALYDRTVLLLTEQTGVVQNYLALNPEIENAIRSSTEGVITSLQSLLKEGSLHLLSFLGALPGFIVIIVITIIATLLTSMSYPLVKEWFFSRFKGRYQSKSRQIATDLGAALIGFLKAQSILVSVTIVITVIGLLITGNQYAFTLGILAGIFDLIPIIGPAVIFIPWALVLFFTGGIGAGIKILLIYLVVTIVRQILEPKILAKNIGLHPLPTLISMYAGLTLFGAFGLILGPAVVVIYEAVRKAGLLQRETPK